MTRKKKVVGEDGKTYYMKEKKPIYKRVWFWILIVLVVGGIAGTLGGDDDTSTTTKVEGETQTEKPSTDSQEAQETSEAPEEYKVGDTVSVDGYEITVNDVQYSDGEGYSTPEQGKQYVIMSITITNNTDEKESFNPLDFSLNVDGVSSTTGFSYVDGIETLSSGDLDPGASVTGNLIGEAPADSSLKLRYEGNMFVQDHEVDIILR